jgi:hypothetical protein
MLVIIKKGVFTQQQLFMVISVLKIKGQFITCKIIYLLFVTICLVFGKDVVPPFFKRYFKSVISNFKNGSDHQIVKYSVILGGDRFCTII